MLKRRFSNNTDAGKPEIPETDMPEQKDADLEHTEDGNGDEEIDGAGQVMDDPGQDIQDDDPLQDEINDSEEPDVERAALQKELSESQDKYLRLAAEFDNYRKRTNREKAELIQTAGESLLKDILPFVDDFERGLDAASKAEDMDAMKMGMALIYSKLKDFLSNHGVKEIIAMNEPFDADWHDAVTNIPAPSDDMKGKIVDVIQKGYTLNDKVMRYPKVVVGE